MSPANSRLAKAIEIGFELAIADGSYQVLVEEVIFTPGYDVISSFGIVRH